jgi:hypothetical protein
MLLMRQESKESVPKRGKRCQSLERGTCGGREDVSLEQGIAHGKERRRPYYRSGRFDRTCRPHGGCPYCYRSRKGRHVVEAKELTQAMIDDTTEEKG